MKQTNKSEIELKEEIDEKIGERNLVRAIKSWGIARDLTKEIRKLKQKLKEKK